MQVKSNAVLVFTGRAFEEILDAGQASDLVRLALQCTGGVVAGRMEPAQKAKLVKLVRGTPEAAPLLPSASGPAMWQCFKLPASVWQ